jgi:lipoprotein-anchoring transpeptidase ErfK/SrfK
MKLRSAPLAATVLLFACSSPSSTSAPPASPHNDAPAAPPAPEATVVVETPAPVESSAPVAEPAPKAVEKDGRPRMAATNAFAYIYKNPKKDGLALGYIRMGTSVVLKSATPIDGAGCSRGWYAVEPRGYACLGPNTTLNLEDPYFKALESMSPTGDATWYYRYAFSNGAPMYSRVPTQEEWEKQEKKFGPVGSYVQLAEWSKGHEELLIPDAIKATDPVPDFLKDGKRTVGGGNRLPQQLVWRVIPNGSMVAYQKSFEANGRVWLLTSDLMVVPADRVRQIRRSTFHGVKLENGLELPLAWNRTKVIKPKLKKGDDGQMHDSGETLASKSWVPVAEEKTVIGGKTYYAIKGEKDMFVAEEDVTLSTRKHGLPSGVSAGEKWIEAKILPGTLTLYEGEKPIYATMFSPGKGGVPIPGHDHTKWATTQIGYFPIEWKDHVATMSNEKSEPKVLWFSDVPHIQYLKAPLAMHVAYWHEDFGNPKSAECVNLSPEDGHTIFGWTEPKLPEGWGGVRPGGGFGKSTPVIITAK